MTEKSRMTLEAFLDKVKSGAKVSFQESIAVIAEHYDYVPTRFVNGPLANAAGTNEGSCKLLYFARLHGLSAEQALALFGDYYWKDVLENPTGGDHANIRNFMRHGWEGVSHFGAALTPKVRQS
jgi:hypothetical protein